MEELLEEKVGLEKPSKLVILKDFLIRLLTHARFRFLIVLALLIALTLTFYSRYFYSDTNNANISNKQNTTIKEQAQKIIPKLNITEKQAEKFYSSLDGTETSKDRANRRPVAVIVENHPEARPQVGLNRASHVWEVVVEGGITRFMAIFAATDAEKIGPVRSARTFFVSWANGYKALFAHAGGSQGGLAQINKTAGITDLPHTNGYFWREASDVATEHTLFTSTAKLYELAAAKKTALLSSVNITQFTDELTLDKRPAAFDLDIDFSQAQYRVGWVYDQSKNIYQRMLAGAIHRDRISGEQLTAKNVVVLEVARRYDPNTNQGKGEWFLTTEGNGKVKIFQNGQVIEGSWKKEAKDKMLILLDQSGNEIKLVRGRTWFEVVEPGTAVTYK